VIPPVDHSWFQRAAEHQARLTMPTGALGRLLDLGRQLCAVQETLQPIASPAAVVVMAADHGVAAEGVSAYPQAVTGQMVQNFLNGGAAINVLARRQNARVHVVDMGVIAPPVASELISCPVAPGTANFLHRSAMSTAQAEQAIASGRRIVAERLPDAKVVALGEMGIGNTTSASALTAALTGQPASAVTGRGTGVDDAAYARKIDVVQRAVAIHFAGQPDPLTALAAVGGFEIAGLVGVALEAASRRILVVLDGFISSVAALIAVRIDSAMRDYCVAAHRSVEKGHQLVLAALELQPMLDLGLRLGEGSGAALALNLIASAADVMREMATFSGAGVTEKS